MSETLLDFSTVAARGIHALADALTAIGLKTIERTGSTGFLDHVDIEDGAILYDAEALPSDLLHEAGHLAIMPPAARPFANGNLVGAERAIGAMMESRMAETLHDDFIQACLQCSDTEATAWAYAFGTACGYAPEQIIRSEQYDGEGEMVRFGLSRGMYIGINGLRAAGFFDRIRDYPTLKKWTQDAA